MIFARIVGLKPSTPTYANFRYAKNPKTISRTKLVAKLKVLFTNIHFNMSKHELGYES